MEGPLVSIIIVSWNSASVLEACLRSINAALEHCHGEIIVVDNASRDGSLQVANRMRSEVTDLRVVAAGGNLGFARANNLALEQARGDYLLLLNPDTALGPRAIAELVACAQERTAAIVGARHYHMDGRPQPSVRGLPTVPALLLLLTKAHHVLPRLPVFTRYFAADFDYAITQPAPQVAGSCFLISRAAFQRLGPMDGRFHVWFEEVDWCRRAHDLGLSVWYCAQARINHHGGQSFGQIRSVRRQWIFNASLTRYLKKHHGMFAAACAIALFPLSLALAAISGVLRPFPRH
ncbi:MAG: glycosyltransferase family 2 protein [bacterium]|nr:glycosyltransferase family 2 protein [bacterium]